MNAVLAIDQGTTSTKAMLVSSTGETLARAAVPVERRYPRPGWVEQDADELWASVRTAIALLPVAGVECIGVTNQRESVLLWDRATGRALTPCVSWQCSRGSEICAELRAAGLEDRVRRLTGLPLEPMFSAPKLRRLLDDDPALRAAAESGTVCAGTVDSWLLWKLTDGAVHATDFGNASRTLLFDIHELRWSDELLGVFDIPPAVLPRVVPSAGVVGESAPALGLGGVPIAALAADSHAALYALGCTEPGTAKATYGTGTSFMTPTGGEVVESRHGLAGTLAWVDDGPTYALEGNVVSSGATVDWLARVLGLGTPAAVERLAASVPDAGGVHIVPAFAGLGAPHWRPDARGLITGLTFGTGAAQLARAAVESIAFQVADLVDAAEQDLAQAIVELRADGGASANAALMQLQADLIDRPVVRSEVPDAAALGVALLAGRTTGAIVEVAPAARRSGRRFEPALPRAARDVALAAWGAAVAGVEPAHREAVAL